MHQHVCEGHREVEGHMVACDVFSRVYNHRGESPESVLKALLVGTDADADMIAHISEHIETIWGDRKHIGVERQLIEHIMCKTDEAWKYVAVQSPEYVCRRYIDPVDKMMRTPLWYAARHCSVKTLEHILPYAQPSAFTALDASGNTILCAAVLPIIGIINSNARDHVQVFGMIASRMMELGISIMPRSICNVACPVHLLNRWCKQLESVAATAQCEEIMNTLSAADVETIVQHHHHSLSSECLLLAIIERAISENMSQSCVIDCVIRADSEQPKAVFDALIEHYGAPVLEQCFGPLFGKRLFVHMLRKCWSADAIIGYAKLMSDDALIACSSSSGTLIADIFTTHCGDELRQLLVYFHDRLGDLFLHAAGDGSNPLLHILCDSATEDIAESYIQMLDDDAFTALNKRGEPGVMHLCQGMARHAKNVEHPIPILDADFFNHQLDLLRLVASRTPSHYLNEKIGCDNHAISEVLQPVLDMMNLTMDEVIPVRTKGAGCV